LIYAVIGLAGAIGAFLRYAVGLLVPFDGSLSFPYTTLLINWLGCFFLGWFLTAADYRISLKPLFKVGVSTGLIGSFTTFSTFSVETLRLVVEHDRWGAAVIYVLLSVWGGLGMVWAGCRTARYGHKSMESGESAP
jgi:CrcB protein